MIAGTMTPEWTAALTTYRPVVSRPAGLPKSVPITTKGLREGDGRNDALFRHLAYWRAKGANEVVLRGIASSWNSENEAAGGDRLDEQEVATIVQSVQRYEEGSAFPWTERGNAQRFVQDHQKGLRYTPEAGWMVFEGSHWEKDQKDLTVSQLFDSTVQKMRAEIDAIANEELKKRGAAWLRQSESAAGITNATKLARSEPLVRSALADFDRNPDLFACCNATVDLRDGTTRENSRLDLITAVSPVAFDPQAEAPLWAAFLDQIFGGDADLIKHAQVSAGYWLTGHNREHKLWIAYGSGRNGKGVFYNVLSHVMGPYATHSPRETFVHKVNEGIANDLAGMRGKRLCVASEFPAEKKPNEELLKQISGGDPITARFLYGEFFTYDPQFKIAVVTNRRLGFSAGSTALWARILEQPFLVTIPADRQNARLKEDLIEKEGPGILNWAMAGADFYYRNGLFIPEKVKSATNAARAENDTVKPFVEGCTEVGYGREVQASDLYATYRSWCAKASRDAVNQSDFRTYLMVELGLRQMRKSGGIVWVGLSLTR